MMRCMNASHLAAERPPAWYEPTVQMYEPTVQMYEPTVQIARESPVNRKATAYEPIA